MTATRPTAFGLCVALLMTITLGLAGARADEGDDASQWTRARIDLGAYRARPAVAGPRLVLPSDASGPSSWPEAEITEAEPSFAFTEHEFEGFVVPPEDLIDFLRASLSSLFDTEYVSAEFVLGQGILIGGRPETVRLAEKATAWLLAGLAPHLDASATLLAEGEEPRLLAAGGVRLWPGVWTQVFRQHRDAPLAADWDIEVAQESTAMTPNIIQLPEGEEAYLRYHPGESTSLVEVWVGRLQHLEMRKVDLSVIRNVPESSAPGTLTLPQTAGYRTYTAFTLPAAEASTRELRWNGPAGPARLRLDFAGASTSPEMRRDPRSDVELYEQVFRIGSVAAALEYERRPPTADAFVDQLRDEVNSYEVYTGILLRYAGEKAGALRARERVLAAERGLRTHGVRLRALTTGEGGVRRLLGERRLAVGRRVDPALLQELSSSDGAALTADVAMPVLENVEASFRAGLSVTGLKRFDVEVAQQSGGMDPRVGSRFAGIHGTVRVARDVEGLRLHVDTVLSWAAPDGGTIDLVFRPPVSMQTDLKAYGEFASAAAMPVLGGGEAVVATSAVAAPDGAEVLLGMTTRGTEAVLLFGSVRP